MKTPKHSLRQIVSFLASGLINRDRIWRKPRGTGWLFGHRPAEYHVTVEKRAWYVRVVRQKGRKWLACFVRIICKMHIKICQKYAKSMQAHHSAKQSACCPSVLVAACRGCESYRPGVLRTWWPVCAPLFRCLHIKYISCACYLHILSIWNTTKSMWFAYKLHVFCAHGHE